METWVRSPLTTATTITNGSYRLQAHAAPRLCFRGTHLFANQFQRPMGGKGCTLLPADDVAAVIAGEEDGAIRLNKLFVGAIVVSGALVLRIGDSTRNPGAEVVGNPAPVHIHGVRQRLAIPRMKPFDCRPGSVEPRLHVRQLAEIAAVFHSIPRDHHTFVAK